MIFFFLPKINLPDGGGGSFGLIGVEGALEMKLSAYTPPFTRCAGSARPVSSACRHIIDTMNMGDVKATFGARGVEGVRFELPIVLTDRES